MARIIILLAVIALVFASVEAKRSRSKTKNKSTKCPNFDNLANFDDPDELAKYQNKVMDNLWDTKSPELTELGEDLEDVLYDMLGSRVPFWRRYALAVSEWIWVYLPELDKNLDFCSFADIINATVNFDNNNDCKAILKSINTTINEFQIGGARILDNIVINGGCGDGYTPIKLPPPQADCYKNGFVYNIDEIWDEIGWEYPCSLQEAVRALYKSCDKRDKIMALLATAVLSKYLAILETGYEPPILYKILTMLTYGKVPKCCCKQLIKDAKELGEAMRKRNPTTFKAARELTGCKCID